MLIKRMGITESSSGGGGGNDEPPRTGETSDLNVVGMGLGAAAQAGPSEHSGQTSHLDAMRNSAAGIATLARGTVLLDRYEIEQVLGIGGMSVVYRARDLRFANVLRYCAVKEMFDTSPDPSTGLLRINNFEREASILATLSHNAIPKIYDYFDQDGKVYLVMEYIDGRDLETILDERQQPMPEDDVLRWGVQICEVLSYLHKHQPQPIVFRDMKPSNVMIDSNSRVMLVDFGIAKVFQSDKKGTMIGTEGYSPPEQYRGVSEPRGDIYALGATIHHLLTGSDPRGETPFTFHERPPRRLNPRISPATEAIVMRALEYDINRRWTSADEMRQALLGVLAQRSPTDAAALGANMAISTPFTAPTTNGSVAPTTDAPWSPSRASEAGTAAMELSAATPVVGDTTTVLWTFSSEDEIRSSPTLHKGIIYVGSYDSNLYALNAKSGDYLWKAATENGISSSPIGWENLVFIGSEDFGVYAFDAVRGRQQWVYRTGQPVRSSPRINNGLLYVGSDDQHIYCLEAKTGRMVWKYRCWMNVRSSAAFAKGNAYIGSGDGHLYALDGSTGTLRWKFRAGGPVLSSPAVGDGLVIFGAMDNSVYAVDLESSWAAWKFRGDHYFTSSPAVAGGRVYIGGVDGYMFCLDVKSGRLIWKYKTGGQITSSPRVFEGSVYFGSVDEHVYCLNASNGSLRWQFKTYGPVPSTPYAADGIVYVGSTDNKLYALAV